MEDLNKVTLWKMVFMILPDIFVNIDPNDVGCNLVGETGQLDQESTRVLHCFQAEYKGSWSWDLEMSLSTNSKQRRDLDLVGVNLEFF